MIQLQFPLPQYQVNAFPPNSFNASFSIAPFILWGILFVAVGFFVIFSLVFVYHWRRYSFSFFGSAKAHLVYFSVSAVLLLMALTSLIIYL